MKADVELRIRHGASLLLRNVEWAVSDQLAEHVLIGRPVLEGLGLDTKTILEAASDKHNGIVNIPEILTKGKDLKNGTLAKIMRDDGIFHSQNGDDGFADDDDIYIDLGEDTKEEFQNSLAARIKEAQENGLSEKSAKQRRDLVFEFHDIFRVRLGRSPPARVEPMIVKLKLGARPVIAKTRRYKADQREFLNRYIHTLEIMGFVRKNHAATWAAAPLLLPNDSRARFRMTVDLRAVNAATENISWPMPHIDSEVVDFWNSDCFATVDFVSGYWQLSLDANPQAAHSIVTPNGIYAPTRTQQGAVNSVANFQSKVEPLFHQMRENLKVWLDDFIIHSRGEDHLLQLLLQFFDFSKVWTVSFGKEECFLHKSSQMVWQNYIEKWCQDGSNKSFSLAGNLYATYRRGTVPVCALSQVDSVPQFAERSVPLTEVLEQA